MAWELGNGPAALGRIGAIAVALASEGHEPIFVIRNLIQPASFLRRHGFAAYQAPDWRSTLAGRVGPSHIAGYADVLASSGFSGTARIGAILAAWDALIDYLQPDAAVADSSPALMLAARGRFPVMAVGDGFMLPPNGSDEFPALLPQVRPVVPQSQLLDMVNQVLGLRDVPALKRLPDMVHADADFVLSLTELDPYAGFRESPAIGPISPVPGAAPPAVGRTVFAALENSYPGLATVLEGLARSELPVVIFMHRVSPELRNRFQNRNIRFVDSPPATALTDASVVMHHGNADAATQALAAGRVQCVVPTSLESHLTGQILVKLGVGEMIPIRDSADHIGGALASLAADRQIAARATSLAQALVRPRPGEILERVADGCRTLLESAG